MKGKLKRKKTFFAKGNPGPQALKKHKAGEINRKNDGEHDTRNQTEQPSPNKIRLTKDLYDFAFSYNNDEATANHTMLLRPLKSPDPPEKHVPIIGYRIVHLQKTLDFFVKTENEHRNYSNRCPGRLVFDVNGEKKWGLGWRETLMCNTCQYKSKQEKLYEEVTDKKSRGPKPATINYGLQVGLAHTPIGYAGITQILSSINIPPPCATGFQNNSNYVCSKLEQLNIESMGQIRNQINTINGIIGKQNEIAVEADCRYNNRLFSGGGRTPYQPGTQAVLCISENLTINKKVIGVHTSNKLCWYRNKGFSCPDHPGKCTASLQEHNSIGNEQEYSKHCYNNILDSDSPVVIGEVTSDGDSHIFKGVQEALRQHNLKTDIQKNTCTRHLGQSLKRKITNGHFSKDFFPGKTVNERAKRKRLFACDLIYRLSGEFNAAYKKFAGKYHDMCEGLKRTPCAIIRCYRNDCSSCKSNSFVCCKRNGKKFQNPYYNPVKWPLKFTLADEQFLQKIISGRLSPESIKLTHKNYNTQKSESVNRAINRVNPKDITFTRNFCGRVHSCVHTLNNGLRDSLAHKLQTVGAPLKVGSAVDQYLRKRQKNKLHYQMQRKLKKNKLKRAILRIKRYKLYEKIPPKNQYNKDMNYGSIIPKSKNNDHTYMY